MTDPDAVAVYGPQAPQRSGVATYIDAMAEHCPPGFRIQRVCNNSWMDPRAAKAVLYHVGASALHHCVFEGLRRRPGPTIVHENNTLSYYYESWDWLKPSVRARVLSMASRRLGRHVGCLEVLQEALDGLPDEDRYCADIGIEQMYLPYLTHALVHSRRLQRRFARLAPDLPVTQVPLMSYPLTTDMRARSRSQLNLSPGQIVFGSFGFIGQYKRVDKILRAWLDWQTRPPDSVLLVVGQPQYNIEIPNHPSIVHIGFVPNATDFLGYLAACDCAVQLRYPTLGETSGVITTFLANNVPLITSLTPDTAEYAGLPNVVRVAPDEAEVPNLIVSMTQIAQQAPPPRCYDPAYSPAVCCARIFSACGLA
jgi:glycosyltransferase involved in cell wall biosynthesis